jgi:ribonuclease HII
VEEQGIPMNIVGCDEVGYGSLAGPLVICGVSAPADWAIPGLNDSKKLSDKRRHELRDELMKCADNHEIVYALAERSNQQIDQVGVAKALKTCYAEVFKHFHPMYSDIIVDGNLKFDNLGVESYSIRSLVKADTLIKQVMAASIIAKVYRDDIMRKLHHQYPNYHWDKNVGYGAPEHLQAIKQYGPCLLHRFSYAPMKNMPVDDPRQLKIPGT